jgi:hypothetical protein
LAKTQVGDGALENGTDTASLGWTLGNGVFAILVLALLAEVDTLSWGSGRRLRLPSFWYLESGSGYSGLWELGRRCWLFHPVWSSTLRESSYALAESSERPAACESTLMKAL